VELQRKLTVHCSKPKILLMILFVFCAGGCPVMVPIPYPVEARNVRSDELKSLDGLYVTLGPRTLIEKFGALLEERLADSKQIDPLTFRDSAFPKGGWFLSELIHPALCDRVRESLSVRYVVLLDVGPQIDPDRRRSVFFGLGTTGYDTEESALSAIVVDLGNSEVLCRVASFASGKEFFFVTWAGGYATDPFTESAVLTGLSDSIAQVLREQHDMEPVAFTVLAIEPLYTQ
jgi:hypothetical protein